jgi:hypothetical protein
MLPCTDSKLREREKKVIKMAKQYEWKKNKEK